MSDATCNENPQVHRYRVLKRRGHGETEIVFDFPRVGAKELDFLLRQHDALGLEYVLEVDGDELVRDEAQALPTTPPPRVVAGTRREATFYSTRLSSGDETRAQRKHAGRVSSPMDDAEARVWETYERLIFAAEESMRRTQRLTEMAVSQHEYMSEELRRLRGEYEEEFAVERKILRQLRASWLERVCDDQIQVEDIARFIAERFSSTKKAADEHEASSDEAAASSETASSKSETT